MKTREELQEEINIRCKLDEERKVSDKKYALKIVETIVFVAVGAIAIQFLYHLIEQAWK